MYKVENSQKSVICGRGVKPLYFQHMAAYSPISSRSHRANLTLPPYQIQLAAAAARRRESANSSIGATSIKRLLTINRGCRHKVPVHIRSKVAKNFTFLVIAHGISLFDMPNCDINMIVFQGLTCAILVPLFGLQVMLFLKKAV